MLRLLELSIIYLHSEAFSTKTTVSEVKYSGLVGLLEHARRLWQLNHIPAVCMYVVPFVRFLFNGNNSTYHLSSENHVDYVSLRDMEIQIVLDSFFNPKNKKNRFQVFIFLSNVCPLYFHITCLFRSCIYTTLRHHCPLIDLCAPFSLFPFPSHKNSHFQNDTECKTFLVKFIFICLRTKNHFHINNVALVASL